MKTQPIFWILFALVSPLVLLGQDLRGNEGKGLLVNLSYGFQVPEGDLKERFGPGFTLSAGTDWITASNWIAGLEGTLIFGNEVKPDVLAPLRSAQGFLYADNLGPAFIELRQRGWLFGGHFGKLLSLSRKNKRSGIRITVGAAFFEHKIRIQDDPQAFAPQIAGEYKKGYDRLTNGLALTQFLGYQHLSRNRRINLTAGFDFVQGFTASRRSWNFDTRQRDEEQRLDLLGGFRVSLSLPFYFAGNDDEVFY